MIILRPSARYSSGCRAPISLPVQYATSRSPSGRTAPPGKKPSFHARRVRSWRRTVLARSFSQPVARSFTPAAAPYFFRAAAASRGYDASGSDATSAWYSSAPRCQYPPGNSSAYSSSRSSTTSAAAGSEMSTAPRVGVPDAVRSCRSGWAAITAPRWPGESISGTTVMCRLSASATILFTSAFVRCGEETTSGCESDSMRKAWSSEKCRPSSLYFRSPSSRMRSSIQPAVKCLRAMSSMKPRRGLAGSSRTTPSGAVPPPCTSCFSVRVP